MKKKIEQEKEKAKCFDACGRLEIFFALSGNESLFAFRRQNNFVITALNQR